MLEVCFAHFFIHHFSIKIDSVNSTMVSSLFVFFKIFFKDSFKPIFNARSTSKNKTGQCRKKAQTHTHTQNTRKRNRTRSACKCKIYTQTERISSHIIPRDKNPTTTTIGTRDSRSRDAAKEKGREKKTTQQVNTVEEKAEVNTQYQTKT